MCGVYPDADVGIIGDEISSTYEGRHVTLKASELSHGSVVAVVTKGRPVWFGDAVGVAFKTEVAGGDLIAVDTEGIWVQDVYARNDAGNSAVVPGDRLFINTTTGLISKIQNLATQIPFGYALGSVDGGNTDTIAVKVHHDPNYENSMQVWKTITVATPGGGAAAFKLIVDNNIAQVGNRLCAMSINLEPGAGLQAQQVIGAEVCTYIAADVPIAAQLHGLFVETQGGLSYASDVHGIYAYLAMNANPTGNSSVLCLQHNSATAAWLDTFIRFVGDGLAAFEFTPGSDNSAWERSVAPNGEATGHIHIRIGGEMREIPMHTPA